MLVLRAGHLDRLRDVAGTQWSAALQIVDHNLPFSASCPTNCSDVVFGSSSLAIILILPITILASYVPSRFSVAEAA